MTVLSASFQSIRRGYGDQRKAHPLRGLRERETVIWGERGPVTVGGDVRRVEHKWAEDRAGRDRNDAGSRLA
jgi:hypothetical protein